MLSHKITVIAGIDDDRMVQQSQFFKGRQHILHIPGYGGLKRNPLLGDGMNESNFPCMQHLPPYQLYYLSLSADDRPETLLGLSVDTAWVEKSLVPAVRSELGITEQEAAAYWE